MNKIFEYRGIEGFVIAEVTEDTLETYTTGDVGSVAGVAELGKETASESEAHYYDNIPAVVIDSVGADTVTVAVSGIPLPVLAKMTGQFYDETLDMLVEGEREPKYFAMGYRTAKTDGTEVLVWRLKGTFAIPSSSHKTKDSGTEGLGQELVYTGISTTHKFTKTGKGAKAINVDTSAEKADVSTFFDEVTTPDTLQAKGA